MVRYDRTLGLLDKKTAGAGNIVLFLPLAMHDAFDRVGPRSLRNRECRLSINELLRELKSNKLLDLTCPGNSPSVTSGRA
jgi:hypothetical protein